MDITTLHTSVSPPWPTLCEYELQHHQGASSMSFWLELQPHTSYLLTRILFFFGTSPVLLDQLKPLPLPLLEETAPLTPDG